MRLIGLGTGAVGMAAFAAAGLGVGIGIDALVRRYRPLYAAPVTVVPVIAPDMGYGMALRIDW